MIVSKILKQRLNVAGCELHYTVQGDGPAVIWIQGVGASGSAWQPQIEKFSDRYTCITFDNRGVGNSQPAGDVNATQMADDVQAIRTTEGLDRVHIVGHSLGGLIGLRYAIDHPETVISLSMLCSFANGRDVAPMSPKMIYWGARTVLGTAAMRRYAFLRLVLTKQFIDSQNVLRLAERMGELMGRDLAKQPSIVTKQLAAMRACNLTEQLQSLSDIPTLIVNASQDPIAPPKLGKIAAQAISKSVYVELENSSHAAPIENADEVNGLLETHFSAT